MINAALATNAGFLSPFDTTHADVNRVEGRAGLSYVQTRWEEDTLNDRGIYKDSKWPWLFEQLESWAENNSYLRTPVLKYSLRAGKLSVAVSGPGSSAGDRRQEAVLSAPCHCGRLLRDHVVRAHRTDAICISGDAGAALCTGTCHRQEEKWIN